MAITGVEDIGKGLIREGTGYVTFPVKYQCVVFRPFKGEILEAVVIVDKGTGRSKGYGFVSSLPIRIRFFNSFVPSKSFT